MFEVGKKYQRVDAKDCIFDCVYAAPEYFDYALIVGKGGLPFIRYREDFKHYKEHVEPVRHVRYFAVTKEGIFGPFTSHAGARAACGKMSLGIKRVEFVEGEFDE